MAWLPHYPWSNLENNGPMMGLFYFTHIWYIMPNVLTSFYGTNQGRYYHHPNSLNKKLPANWLVITGQLTSVLTANTTYYNTSTEMSAVYSLIAMFMGPIWGASGADRTQVGPMLAPWTSLSGLAWAQSLFWIIKSYKREIMTVLVPLPPREIAIFKLMGSCILKTHKRSMHYIWQIDWRQLFR